MFIFNDMKNLLLSHKNNTALWTFQESNVRFRLMTVYVWMTINGDKDIYWLPIHPTLITSPGLKAKG